MTAYLSLLLVFSALASGQPFLIVRGILIVLMYSLFDGVWTYLRDKSWYLPVSSWISGLILALVAWPDMPWFLIIALPLLAVFSKQLLHFGKMRHIFNPASFALALASIFVPVVSWWGQSSGNVALAAVSAVGVFILWRQSRWHESIAFVLSYVLFLIVMSLSAGADAGRLAEIISGRIFQGSIIFFVTVMLIEPITSQFPSKKQRIIYGVLVGFLSVFFTYLQSKVSLLYADPLILGLLLGNITASLLFLPNVPKQPARK